MDYLSMQGNISALGFCTLGLDDETVLIRQKSMSGNQTGILLSLGNVQIHVNSVNICYYRHFAI